LKAQVVRLPAPVAPAEAKTATDRIKPQPADLEHAGIGRGYICEAGLRAPRASPISCDSAIICTEARALRSAT
jgi:hypothetical protein